LNIIYLLVEMMRLNVINNYKTIYYNFLTSFYLCLNCVLPYYDDVIISLQSQAIKLLIDNDTLNMKKVKKIRMIEFIDSLDKSDKIILDKERDIILGLVGTIKDKDEYYNMGVSAVSSVAATAAKYFIEDSGSSSADTVDTDEDGLDKEIDVSIINTIQNIIYDKNKDD